MFSGSKLWIQEKYDKGAGKLQIVVLELGLGATFFVKHHFKF
jgi:hypothetical protein